MPFEVPESWVWTTIGNIGEVVTGNTPSKDVTDYYGGNIPFFKPTDLEQGIHTVTSKDHLTELGYEQSRKLPAKSVLVTCIGATIGKTGLIETDGTCNQQINAIVPSDAILSIFLYYLCISNYLQQEIKDNASATTLPILNKNNFAAITIPLPPLAEQHRIVSEIERWFSLIDIIESGKENLKSAVKQVKTKILDLAIHGKLVPQDPTDEPASELLHRINPTAEITSDNAQYGKIPEGWCMVKGKDLFKPMKSIKPSGITFKYIDIDSIDNKCNKIKETKTVETSKAPSRASRYTEKYDVVFSMVRPYLRNIAIVEENNCIASTGFYICSPYDYMYPQFCYVLMLSNYVVDGLNTFMKGDNSPSINKGNVDNWTFPLPPLVEQRRIVAKIEELFAQLNLIEAEL